MKRPVKALPLLGIVLATLTLSACDRCGDPVQAQNGNTPMACKGERSSPN